MGRNKNGQRGIREIREGAPRQSYGERFAGSNGAGDGGGVEVEGEVGDGEAENRDPKNEVYVHEPVVSQEDYNILFAKPVFASNNRRRRSKAKDKSS
jgi:hypothetical protein